jgi:putative transposase
MAGKFLCVNLHIIWSTKGRRRLIHPEWAERLHAYLGSVARAKNSKLLAVNSVPDHVHLYVSLPSTISIADLVNAFKSNSSRWIRQTFPNQNWFSWQEGYAAFSVSRSRAQELIEYIHGQHEHHKKQDFQQELIELLRRHEIEYDPRYVFG